MKRITNLAGDSINYDDNSYDLYYYSNSDYALRIYYSACDYGAILYKWDDEIGENTEIMSVNLINRKLTDLVFKESVIMEHVFDKILLVANSVRDNMITFATDF